MSKPTQQRAYAMLKIKSFDDKARTFSGVASSISTDRMGDIVEPKGAQFMLPMPFLWQHDSRDPIGWIEKAKVTGNQIEIEGRVADIPAEDSPVLKERLQTAWAYMKNGLVPGLSIGFREIESESIEGTWGYRFTAWDWLELSAVTIPANPDARITLSAIRSEARKQLAASGRSLLLAPPVTKAHQPGATGSNSVSQKECNMKLKEQIAALE